jgi:hypothetical protein
MCLKIFRDIYGLDPNTFKYEDCADQLELSGKRKPVSQLLPPETRFWKRTTLRAVLFSRVVWANCDVGGTAATDKVLCIVHGLA